MTPTPRLLLRSREGVRFHTPRADGSIAPDGCLVREAYATLRVLVGDTLRLEQVEIRRLARNPEPCAMPSGTAVVIVAQSDLEMRVFQPSAERSFLAGMLIAPLVFLTFLAALWR